MWEEYRACLADEIDAEILDQYKKAFYGGTWFIIATFMALADEKRDEHFIRGMEALRDEISEFRTDLKQWIIREAGKPRDYQAPETVLRTKREGPVKIDPVEALVRQAVSMNWKQVHEIKKEDVAADDFAQAMVSIRFARGNEEAVVRRKDATVTLVRRHAPPTFDGFDELEEWVAENPENNGDGIVSDEALYLREIEKNVTRLGHFDTLLEAQGTDKKFFLACAKYHKAAYVAEESATLVAALTLEALRRYRSDRAWGISCLAGLGPVLN